MSRYYVEFNQYFLSLQDYQLFPQDKLSHSMKTVIHLSDDYLRKYRALKQSLQLPLKISLYFSFLEAALDDETVTKKGQNFHGFSPLFYPTFCKLSKQQKSFYLFSNIEFIKGQYDKIETNSNQRQVKMYSGNNIKATGQISDTIMSLSYWLKVQIDFNFQLRKIKLIAKNRQFQIDLRLYLIRKSKKYENTVVLEAISEVVPAHDRKISLFFKASIFQDIFMEIFKCIVNFRNLQLYKVAIQDYSSSQSLGEVSYIGKNSRSLDFLTAKNINEFLNFKDKILKKMIRAQFKFDKIYSVKDCKIEKDETFSGSDFSLYKLQSSFNHSVEVLKKTFLEKYRSQSNKYLIQSQQLEKSSTRFQAKYQKLLFNSTLGSYKTIQQILIEQLNLKEQTTENEQLVFLKGVKGVKLANFLQFLMVKVKGMGTQNRSKLIIVGSFSKNFETVLKGQLKTKKPNIQIQETQQLILMYLLQFSEMIFRKQDNGENMEKILSGLRAKSMDQLNQNYLQEPEDKNQDKQFHTVIGNFKNYDREEIVINPDQFQENFQNENNFQNKQIETEVETQNINKVEPSQLYLLNKYELQPSPPQIDEKREKNIPQAHFLFEEWYRKPKGGIVCKEENAINEQKKVANFILKNLGKRIFQQKGILNLSLPVTIFKPESHLQSIARNLSFAPIFLQKAVSIKDPIERIKYVVLYALSVTVSSISINKPFNPLLGQTLQVRIDGCPVYLQQISHHPPVSSYYMIGRGYKVHGSIGSKVNFGFNSITGYTEQPNFVQFDDGSIFELNFGKMVINGIVIGERTFNFIEKMYIMDSKNKLFSELKFGQEKTSIFSSSQQPQDYFFGKIQKISDKFIEQFNKSPRIIYPNKESSEQLCKFEGTWNGKVSFDQKLYNDFSISNGCVVQAEKFVLPSDSTFRKDIEYLKQGQANGSQHQKQVLQNIQRRERQLRKSYAQQQ